MLPGSAPTHARRTNDHPIVGKVLGRDHGELRTLGHSFPGLFDIPAGVAGSGRLNTGTHQHVDHFLLGEISDRRALAGACARFCRGALVGTTDGRQSGETQQ